MRTSCIRILVNMFILAPNPAKWLHRGEYPIGISFEYPAIQLKRQGAPLDIILPQEGLGWDIEATAIIKRN